MMYALGSCGTCPVDGSLPPLGAVGRVGSLAGSLSSAPSIADG